MTVAHGVEFRFLLDTTFLPLLPSPRCVCRIEAPEAPQVGDIMRLAVEGSKGPVTVDFIYTSTALLQKAEEALKAVDAMASHLRKQGDGHGLILCTTVEHNVRAVLRKEYSIQQELRSQCGQATENTSVSDQLVDALRRQVKAQQEVIDNYQRSLSFYEQADKSPSATRSPEQKEEQKEEQKDGEKEKQESAMILAVHFMYTSCTPPYTPHVHLHVHLMCTSLYTSCTPHVHLHVHLMYTSIYTSCTPHVHLMYTSCTPRVHLMYTSCTPPCTPRVHLPVHLMYISCTPDIHHMYTSCTPHVHLMYTSCTPHVHLHVHVMYT